MSSRVRYGIRIRRTPNGRWHRGKQFRRVGRRWIFWRKTWPTRAAAQMRLRQLVAKGYRGHVFEIHPDWRDEITTAMKWCLKHEPDIHYRQTRPFDPELVAVRYLPITTDCSGSTTMLYYAAGVDDPNGRDYDGTGYTGTLREHLPAKPLPELKRGDLIIYGPGSGAHVVVVYEPHPADPLCFSHGQESGPALYRHSVELDAHGGYYTSHGYA